MKAFAIWLAIVAVVFGGYALITTTLRETNRVFVVVDTSYQMTLLQPEVQRELDRIDDEEHAEFALATEKDFVHSWQSELDLVGATFYAPCTFDGIDQYPEAQVADERILITTTDNACAAQAAELTDWTIIELD